MSTRQSFKPSEGKKKEFRQCLEKAGILDALTKVLVKFYEETDKPEDVLTYIIDKLSLQAGLETPKYLTEKLDEANDCIKAMEQEIEALTTHAEEDSKSVRSRAFQSVPEVEEQPIPKIVPASEVNRFILECLAKLGVDEDKAEIFADGMVQSDLKGIISHGLNRLPLYILDIQEKNCNPNANPTIIAESASTATVCGNNGFGTVIGKFCMGLAMKKAKETGIAMVVANGSNHFGLNSFYSEYAVSNGFIGMAFTNTSPLMVPSRAKKTCFGTNPLSIGAPAENDDSVIIDFATTAVALGKIDVYMKKGMKIPLGWAYDEHGRYTTDAKLAHKLKNLAPLGGITEGHKGTSLAFMVEILSGLLSGSSYGPHIRVWGQKPSEPANLGHGFIAIDPSKFCPGFEKRLGELMTYIRNMEPADPKKPVLVPGDMEKRNKEMIDEQGGIEYSPAQLKTFEKLVNDLGVKPLKFKS